MNIETNSAVNERVEAKVRQETFHEQEDAESVKRPSLADYKLIEESATALKAPESISSFAAGIPMTRADCIEGRTRVNEDDSIGVDSVSMLVGGMIQQYRSLSSPNRNYDIPAARTIAATYTDPALFSIADQIAHEQIEAPAIGPISQVDRNHLANQAMNGRESLKWGTSDHLCMRNRERIHQNLICASAWWLIAISFTCWSYWLLVAGQPSSSWAGAVSAIVFSVASTNLVDAIMATVTQRRS